MESTVLGIPLLLGISLMGGALGAWFFQRLRIPQVVGYIAIGLMLGNAGFGIMQSEHISQLRPLNLFALGLIGFLVGGELKIDTFKKYARQFSAILFGEGISAFILVSIGSFIVLYFVMGEVRYAIAAAVVFGAIASATDPASTIDVLWEYRSLGVLTTSITAIVALDDALAMSLYALGTGVAKLLSSGEVDFFHEIMLISIEVFGALIAGGIFAIILRFILKRMKKSERSLAISIGLILLLIGISVQSGMDIILATMMMGFTLINLEPRRSEDIFKLLRGFSEPIYVLFFVLVGARLTITGLPGWLWLIVVIYIIGRSVGKISGAWIGARISGAEEKVRHYLGIGLFAQGGVAVGLSIMASHNLSGIMISDGLSLGDAIIYAITTTTLIVQVSGPPLVKYVIQKSGEAGRNITDEDVIVTYKVNDVMTKGIEPFKENMRIVDAIDAFSRTSADIIPVVNNSGNFIGTVSLYNMRNVLGDQSTWQWLLVNDILEPTSDQVDPQSPLQEALDYMNQLHINQMPVVKKGEQQTPVGMLDINHVKRQIADEVIQRKSAMV